MLARTLVIFLVCTLPLHAGTLIVTAPTPVKSATAVTSAKGATPINAAVNGKTATFANVPDNAPLTVRVHLTDGTELQGVDLSWYSGEPAKPDASELTDDDRQAIRAIVQDVPSFYNKSDLLLLMGNHDRAVALVQLVRDTDFHASGGNVVWRVELYYFKFQYGGWEKVPQQNKVVRRERFKSPEAHRAAVDKLRWVAALGGLPVRKDEERRVEVGELETPTTVHGGAARE